MMDPIVKARRIHIALVCVIVLLIGAFTYSVYKLFTRPPADTTVATIAPPSAAIKGETTVDTVVKVPVKTYKPTVKKKLRLPEPVIASPDQQVTGSTTIKPSERSVTVTSVIDSKTGETTTYEKPEPLPWLAVESRGEARFDYGYKVSRNRGVGAVVPMPVGRLSVVHNFIQVKALHAGVNAAIDTDGSAFIGIGLAYRW